MTTEQVVVLFTDVVGSTERSIGHTFDEVDETRRAHFSILRQAIAETGGTEIKNTGGAPLEVWQNGDWTLSWADWAAGSALA